MAYENGLLPEDRFDSDPGHSDKPIKNQRLTKTNDWQVSPQVALAFFMKSLNQRKYRHAVLVIPAPGSKDQRWVIKYYDTINGKYQMVRELDCNSIDNLDQRKAYCEKRIRYINAQLDNPTQPDHAVTSANLTMRHAIAHCLSMKQGLRQATMQNYGFYSRKFIEWCEEKGLADAPAIAFTRTQAEVFLSELISVQAIGNRTRNNYLSHLNTLFIWLVKNEHIPKNPFTGIEKLKEETGRNIAYTHEQQAELITYMKQHEPQLLFFCQFMYYTLMRTKEISMLKVGDIGRNRTNQIHLPPTVSKNRHERNIVIAPALEDLFQQHGIRNLPGDWYLFGAGTCPSPEFRKGVRVAEDYRIKVLNKLGYSQDYTMYSWKHTGVVAAYFAGIPKAAIRLQLGHTNDDSFEAYLKSLGLYENDDFVTKFPALPGV